MDPNVHRTHRHRGNDMQRNSSRNRRDVDRADFGENRSENRTKRQGGWDGEPRRRFRAHWPQPREQRVYERDDSCGSEGASHASFEASAAGPRQQLHGPASGHVGHDGVGTHPYTQPWKHDAASRGRAPEWDLISIIDAQRLKMQSTRTYEQTRLLQRFLLGSREGSLKKLQGFTEINSVYAASEKVYSYENERTQ